MAINYKKKLEKSEKPLNFYIPSDLDIDGLIKTLPTQQIPKFDKWKLLYIVHLITYLPAVSKQQRNIFGYINLSSKSLKSVIPNYKLYINYLIEKGVIEGNESYSTKSHFAKSYRLCKKWLKKNIERVEVPKSKFRTGINKYSETDSNKQEIDIQLPFLRQLEINMEAAQEFLRKIGYELMFDKDQMKQDKFNLRKQEIEINLMRIAVGDISIIVDSTSGRVHSNMTGLKKEFRHFITYKGEPLMGIDIRNSQPYILQRIFQEEFWIESIIIPDKFFEGINYGNKRKQILNKTTGKERGMENKEEQIIKGSEKKERQEEEYKKIKIYHVKERIKEILRKKVEIKGIDNAFNMWQNREKHEFEKEICDYKTILNEGDLYEVLLKTATELLQKDKTAKSLWSKNIRVDNVRVKKLDRDSVKLMILIALYAPKKSKVPLTQFSRYVFQSKFPLIIKFMDALKHLWILNDEEKWSEAYNSVAILLQAIESEIMMNRVLPRISSEHPEIPVFTIHDCILTSRPNVEIVRSILEEEFEIAIGNKPGIKIEDYSLESLKDVKMPYVDPEIDD